MALCCSPVAVSCRIPCKFIPTTHFTRPTNAYASFQLRPSLSLSLSSRIFSGSALCTVPSGRPLIIPSRRPLVVVAATDKSYDSAVKRHRQSEKRRLYNRSRKSEIHTRMKKVFLALEALRKSKSPSPEDVLPIEKLISEAYKTIDKAVKVGTVHRNTGGHRKSRLARRKRAVLVHHGWYKPEAA